MSRLDGITAFDRDLLIEGLRLLVAALRDSGQPSDLRIIGGAALALRYFDRGVTVDIDAHFIGSPALVDQAALTVAEQQGWPSDWLNNAAGGFIPEYGSTRIEWQPVFVDGDVVIEVAPPDAMLAMKLRANRPGRDDDDIARLLAICGIDTLDEAESLYEGFYSGEVLPARAIRMVERILRVGLPDRPQPQPPIDLGSASGGRSAAVIRGVHP
ncbi:hypothetical protein ACFQ58_13525 [Agromyces sp. NPDC056523]|uniref:hypothetical protein n=1 Tax=Agromyces sp. NPDC056523 TaxID=3345850 RepID=UPI00366AAFB1